MALDPISLDDAAMALGFVPAHQRDIWVRMAMALKSEFGEQAFDVFDNWSQTADNYHRNAVRATWKSSKPGGAVGIGSLLHEARQYGYEFTRPQPTPEQQQAIQAEQVKRRAAIEKSAREFEAWQGAWHARIAELAQTIFVHHTHPTGSSKYLGSKHCGAHGIGFVREGFVVVVDDVQETARIISDKNHIREFMAAHTGAEYQAFKDNGGWMLYARRGTLAVPLRNAAGDITNLQFIFVDAKKFIKNGRKSGLFHLLGHVTPHTQALLLAEGYATAATLHEATDHPVAMAIDCGNLLPVAQALRGQYPDLPIVVCADDDAETEGNPGKAKAMEAAAAVGGLVVLPVFEMEADA